MYKIFGLLISTFIISGGVFAAPTGGPLPDLTVEELNAFNVGLEVFQEVDTIEKGFGPRFNGNSCAACHIHPAVGGTSPPINPQIEIGKNNGTENVIPSFITLDGPVRVARMVYSPRATGKGNDRNIGHGSGQYKRGDLDGGVHDLFVVTGMNGTEKCNVKQPDFSKEMARNNVIFRIPTPVFGLGLVEDVPDDVLIANAVTDKKLGISPHFNYSPNDGTISRFGWKAQVKSLLMFAGEAYNVEQGITNALFPNERDASDCSVYGTEDKDNDIVKQANFMRLTAPPTTFPMSGSAARGKDVFVSVGCAACHVPTQTTSKGVQFNPYSDFSLHSMGETLSDGILQGNAGPDEFRTAPLWGVSQRLFFLHDGRTNDLLKAILLHEGKGSQANVVIGKFKSLSPLDRQAVLDFLRTL